MPIVALAAAALGLLMTLLFVPVILSGFFGFFLFQIPVILGYLWFFLTPILSTVAVVFGAVGLGRASNANYRMIALVGILIGVMLLVLVAIGALGVAGLVALKNS